VTPQEKLDRWQKTITALNQRDPRVHLGFLVALLLRHGKLEQCQAGHTHVLERITLEELYHAAKEYQFAIRIPETGVFELQAVPRGDTHVQRNPDSPIAG
jgi:hypothetical protein